MSTASSSKSTVKLSTTHQSIRSSDSVELHEIRRLPDRIELINRIIAGNGNKLEGLLMTTEDESHIVHHDHDDDSNCNDAKCILRKRVRNFSSIMSKIGGDLEYIKSGTTGHTLKGTMRDENFSFAVKIVAYPKKKHYNNPNDIERPENAELLMLKLLSQLVVSGKTPHIMLPIGTFNADLSEIIAITRDNIKDSERYTKFIQRYQQAEFYPQASVLLSEWADKGDLLDYIRSNYKNMGLVDWQAIFFQILQGFATIHNKYPAFRHNDAKANNFLCRSLRIEPNKRQYHTYRGLGKYSYLVPNVGVQIGLWDFDFACIPGEVNNTKVFSEGTDHINVRPTRHQYYDIHFFFNTLGCTPFFPKLLTSKDVPDEVKEFVDRVVPPRYRSDKRYVTDGGRIKTEDEIWTPLQLLETDPFFKPFRFTREKLAERKEQLKTESKRSKARNMEEQERDL